MGWFNSDSEESQNYDTFQNCAPENHQATLSHEVIGGAAAFEAMKAYENHCAENGQPESHAKAKELLAGFAGAFVDREVETRGLDFADKEKAKYNAQQRLNDASAQDF